MTTAHRPTWKAAVGQANEGGWSAGGAVSHQRSALDAPAHTKLKYRHDVVDKRKALQESLLALEDADKKSKELTRTIGKRPIDPAEEERAKQKLLLKQTAEIDVDKIKEKYDDDDISDSSDESDLDADDDSDLDDDDEDDEAALQAELAKIRAEREEAKRKQEDEAALEESARNEEVAVLGNPLLNQQGSTTGRLKRRWNDDVVFRNQAKGDAAPKKRFINDTVRNDFHRRFLNKYIR